MNPSIFLNDLIILKMSDSSRHSSQSKNKILETKMTFPQVRHSAHSAFLKLSKSKDESHNCDNTFIPTDSQKRLKQEQIRK